MSLTTQQVGEAGEAINAAMDLDIVSVGLRGELVNDLYSPPHQTGNVEFITAVKRILADVRVPAHFKGGLAAYRDALMRITGPAPAPQPPQPAPTPAPPKPPAPAPAPLPSSPGGTMPGLTAAQIGAANEALYRGMVAGRIENAPYHRIEDDLFGQKYALIVDKAIIDIIKGWYYGGATQADRDAIHPVLAIYDQRIPGTDDLLPKGDPRIRYPQASAPSPAPAPAPGPAPAPVTGVQRFENVVISGKLAIGMEPDPRCDAVIQIGSAGSAEVLLRSANTGQNPQNPGYASDCVVSAGRDGGFRLIHDGFWGPQGFQKSAPNRPLTILALDSMGTLSYSQEWKDGSDGDRAQHMIVKVNRELNTIDVCSMKAGWRFRWLESSRTNAADRIVGP